MVRESELAGHVRDQLRLWAPVTVRRMFGGHGLFRADRMFALIHDETLYFRTDDGNRLDFEGAGMPPFAYDRGGTRVALGYHEVPADILDEAELLGQWAEKAYAAALRRTRAGNRQRLPA